MKYSLIALVMLAGITFGGNFSKVTFDRDIAGNQKLITLKKYDNLQSCIEDLDINNEGFVRQQCIKTEYIPRWVKIIDTRKEAK